MLKMSCVRQDAGHPRSEQKVDFVAKPNGTCVFCGFFGRMTGEHVFPEWMQDSYPIDTPVSYDIGGKRWEQAAWTLEVNAVCEQCNCGWMADMETTARQVLAPMFAGVRTRLRPGMQRVLAAWVLKTTMMLEQADAAVHAIPAVHYHHLNRTKEPPPSIRIWVGVRGALGIPAVVMKGSIQNASDVPGMRPDVWPQGLPSDERIYRTTLCIGQVAFVTTGHNVSALPKMSMTPQQPAGPETLHRIWPTGPLWTWPPPVSVERLGLG